MFYIYEWFNIDTNEVFYVGKGCYNRYKVKKRNSMFNEYIKNNNCDVRIVERYDDELMCFKREEELISYYQSLGQCKCNCRFGGCGGVKEYWTEEMKNKMSRENPMKAAEQRERMSRFNPMKDAQVAKRVGEKHRKPFYIGDNYFATQKDAAQFYSVAQATIYDWLKKGKNPHGEKCYFVNKSIKPIKVFKDKCYIIFKGKKYKSMRELAEKENISSYTVSNWLKRGFSSRGEYIRYSNDNREYVYNPPNKSHNCKPIIVNGVIYNSISEASKILKICNNTLVSLLKGNNTYKYKNLTCRYVNQQPSANLNDL